MANISTIDLQAVFQKVDNSILLDRDDIFTLLAVERPELIEAVRQKAYELKVRLLGRKVYFRGIIEFSNICEKDCYYCGIRRDNRNVERFLMSEDEIVKEAIWIYENKYASLVLQSGERSNPKFVDFVERILRRIREATDGRLRVTLSLGEQSAGTYERWFLAGAHRYLLRIETSDEDLYRRLHPPDHDFNRRFECLRLLRNIGYQVGTGVMIGLPGQTLHHLVDDILFFRDNDIDMIGMGPYLPHSDTPLGQHASIDKKQQLQLGLKMISATRLVVNDVNIAATTALQALDPKGREMGVLAGANVIMPNVTDTRYRPAYQLYDEKPCINENSTMCRGCLAHRIMAIGEEIGYDEWGDSLHYRNRLKGKNDFPQQKIGVDSG